MSGDNPFQTPQAGPFHSEQGVPIPAEVTKNTLDFGQVLGDSVKIYQEKFVPLFVSNLILLGWILLVLAVLFGIPTAVAAAMVDSNPNGGPPGEPSGAVLLVIMVFGFFSVILYPLALCWMLAGFNTYLFQLVRGEQPSFGVLFSGTNFLPYLGVLLLLSIAVNLGMCLLIIPGLFLALSLWPAPFLVLENRYSVMNSFKKAWELTEGNRLTMLLIAFILGLINGAGALLLYVGMLFTLPFVNLAVIVAYFMITSQPTYLQAEGK
ncbi:Hypothetical protein PBC10988_13060 [Planctomycetales bacterium 10988]|nr:Hypothetical protein PBC10988_13060 [Planctomycetales bacterium 10988]